MGEVILLLGFAVMDGYSASILCLLLEWELCIDVGFGILTASNVFSTVLMDDFVGTRFTDDVLTLLPDAKDAK